MSTSSGSIGSVEMDDQAVSKLDLVQDPKKMSFRRGDHKNPDEEKKEETDRKESLNVRKVSPVKKFFSSIRVLFILFLILFFWVFVTAVGWSMIVLVRQLYEEFDELDMKERIQHAVHGTISASIALYQRGLMAAMTIGTSVYPYGDFPYDGDHDEEEIKMVSTIVNGMQILVEGPGLIAYEDTPFQILMLWDDEWNERMVYYRTCIDPSDVVCTLPPPEDALLYNESGYPIGLKYKDKVPSFIRNKIPEIMKQKEKASGLGNDTLSCGQDLSCAGFLPIPKEEGGDMLVYLFDFGDVSANFMMNFAFNKWHALVGLNAKIVAELHANRTGLCVAFYDENETDVPKVERNEFNLKRKKKHIMNPVDVSVDTATFFAQVLTDSGNWTTSIDYYSNKVKSFPTCDRQYCDPYYNHGEDGIASKSRTYLTYSTFNPELLGQDDSDTVMLRFEYHDPHVQSVYGGVKFIVAVVAVLFFLTLLGVFLYFDIQFLRPLDGMRKVREDLIKTALSGLDDDGVKAKDLFGDLIDDEALIKANGDEISVMMTLQHRMDALYSSVIDERVDELNRLRSVARGEQNALRVMNLFMRRDDEALRIVLPGLIDPNEMARRFRRTTLTVRQQKGENWMDDLANAKHAFRTLKAVLGNYIAAQYFKAFCTQRGRSSLNSLFFLMDVSWLHQVESGARDDGDDFLSAMFSDSVSPSPASMSPRSPYLCLKNSDDGMGLSSDLLVSAESSAVDLHLPQADPSRPHHSHFAKSRNNNNGSRSDSPSSPIPGSETPDEEKDNKNNKTKVPKLPIAAMKATGSTPSGSGSPGSMSPSSPARNAPQFLTKIGDGIAHFIHESYFGRKSLAQHDMRHAALLGCSQIPDYLTLRDKEKVVYSPTMYDNLVTAVTKKFTSEVLPQFLNSLSFQVLVRSLMITGFFKKTGKDKNAASAAEAEKVEVNPDVPVFEKDSILKYMWITTKGEEKQGGNGDDKSDSDDTSTSSSGDDEENDDEQGKGENDEKKGEEKKDESDDSSSESSSDSEDSN